MENRIKILYIITIVAILVFLGMQAYWLYGRYEYYLKDYEDEARKTVLAVIDEYRDFYSDRADTLKGPLSYQSNYNIESTISDNGKFTRVATIVSRRYDAHKILGIKENRELSSEEKQRAAAIALADVSVTVNTFQESFDVSDAPSESSIWGAFKNLDIEIRWPMNVPKLDSMLTASGIRPTITLIRTDSIVWTPTLRRHSTIFNPSATVTVPYSELERKSVMVECHIPLAAIFGKMAGSLVIAAMLSLFLIICLVWQFSTVLKLSRLDKMRNSFVTTMIHELKRPISTLKMCVSGIGNDRMMSDVTAKEEIIAETRNALDRLSAYFSKLRDITFNDVEQIPLNITPVNLHGLFDSVSDGIVIPDGKKAEIVNGISESLEVSADQSHLFNILSNLVENAVKYSGDAVEVQATATTDEQTVTIAISDNGNGIAAGDLRHIFKRFYRGKASATDLPGMGLGLAYVKLLVEAHGGEISVESAEGKGTCFTIILPQ